MAKRAVSIEEIASEVGRLFGTTEAHAKHWLKQRNDLVHTLSVLRDRTTGLIAELGGENPFPVRKRGHKAREGVPVVQPGMRQSRKKRVLSAQTRTKMRAAAKKRWAAIRSKAGKNVG